MNSPRIAKSFQTFPIDAPSDDEKGSFREIFHKGAEGGILFSRIETCLKGFFHPTLSLPLCNQVGAIFKVPSKLNSKQ